MVTTLDSASLKYGASEWMLSSPLATGFLDIQFQ